MIYNEKEIYDYILENVINIENELKNDSNDLNDEKIDEAKLSTINLIESFRKSRLEKSIEELKNNQEWEDFTIAFYGETNAGKSTIIESLRLYFEENEKIATQNKFRYILNDYELKIKKIRDLEILIEEITTTKINKTNEFENEDETLKIIIEESESEELHKINSSFIYKLFAFFNFNGFKEKIKALNNELKNKQILFEKELLILNEDLDKKEILLNSSQNELLDLENKLLRLEDGQIIGDGQSDFTKNISTYEFTNNGQTFKILDVPGIEGNEKIVIDEIEKAVKKAHAIFYVTSSSTPPQKGDDNKKGTLEKIKEHLSNQVEIYTIFNKRITNPMQLHKVIKDEELESLKVLDEKMSLILGNNYAGNKYLSARVSFLSLATCLVPQSKTHKEREKFIEKFPKEDLLEKSFFQDFCNFMSNSLVQNTKRKIKKANFNKANMLLKEFINILSNLLKNNLNLLENEIIKDTANVKNSLENSFNTMKNDIETALKKDLRKFENNTRKEIYDYIDTNISDDNFKTKFEEIKNENIEIFSSNIPIFLEKETKKFQDTVINILDNFKRRINNSIQDFNTFNMKLDGNDFVFDIDIKSGINKWGLVGSIASSFGSFGAISAAIAAGISGIGLIFISILSVATVVIALLKSIRKSIDDDYKRSEQKKEVDKNLQKIITEIENILSEKIDEIIKEFTLIINQINEDLSVVLNHIQKLNNLIYSTQEKLQIESKLIEIEGDK